MYPIVTRNETLKRNAAAATVIIDAVLSYDPYYDAHHGGDDYYSEDYEPESTANVATVNVANAAHSLFLQGQVENNLLNGLNPTGVKRLVTRDELEAYRRGDFKYQMPAELQRRLESSMASNGAVSAPTQYYQVPVTQTVVRTTSPGSTQVATQSVRQSPTTTRTHYQVVAPVAQVQSPQYQMSQLQMPQLQAPQVAYQMAAAAPQQAVGRTSGGFASALSDAISDIVNKKSRLETQSKAINEIQNDIVDSGRNLLQAPYVDNFDAPMTSFTDADKVIRLPGFEDIKLPTTVFTGLPDDAGYEDDYYDNYGALNTGFGGGFDGAYGGGFSGGYGGFGGYNGGFGGY